MGWLVSSTWTRKSLIQERTECWSTKKNSVAEGKPTYIVSTCLKHCYRGNAFSGVLWGVWEQRLHDTQTDAELKTELFISCDLLRCSRGEDGREWGYKDMEESMGPCYYSCPLGYLEMAPVANENWREDVRKYHDIRRLKFKPKVGMVIKLKDGCNPQYLTVVKTRPLRGQDRYGRSYKIPKKLVDKEVVEEPIDSNAV